MSSPAKGPSIRFRGRNFLALVVAPDPPLGTWLVDLDDWLSRAPAFFKGRPVVLDLSAMAMDRSQIPVLVAELGRRGIKVMGVDGADVEWLGIGVPPDLVGGKGDPAPDFQVTAQPQEGAQEGGQAGGQGGGQGGVQAARPLVAAAEGAPTSLVVDETLRSGRSVFFPTGDVTIIGAVQSGAEVIAGGTVTVHGPLRGRAIAGVAGQPGARIICRRFEAELVAIDGIYLASDSLDPSLWAKPVHVRLQDETLRIEILE